MPDDVKRDADSHEAKIQRAISVSRLRHLERYGVDAVDEPWIRSLSDSVLDHLISPRDSRTPI